MSRVLVIGDLHLPAEHKDYFDFVKKIKRKYKTTSTVFIGDVMDHHNISFHKKHVESTGAMEEFKEAYDRLAKWKRLFPKAKVCIGNHDERVMKISSEVGIPQMYLRNYAELYNTPRWEWDYSFEIDGVFYHHGTGTSGQYPAYNAARSRAMSTVSGHCHSVSSINWMVGPTARIFGMNVGCGVNKDHIAMAYGTTYLRKPVVSCGVVIDGHPYLELMDL
jgi:predicted phosphodiesterase